MPATIWQVLNVKCKRPPETEIAEIRLRKIREITSDIFVADFTHLDLLCISRFTYNEVKSYNKHVCGYRLQKEAPVTFYRPK